MHSLKTAFRIRYWNLTMGLLLIAFLCGCSRSTLTARHVTGGCATLTKRLSDEDEAFAARAQEIRGRHILLQDYDRQMLTALSDYRSALESTLLTDVSMEEDIADCGGKALQDLRLRARGEMTMLLGYVKMFKQALEKDPAGVYIDQPAPVSDSR